MFYRKITREIEAWFERQSSGERTGLVIQGLRQVGKTYIIEQFIRSHYDSVNIINFKDSPNFKPIFDQADFQNGLSDFFVHLSAMMPGFKMKGKTVLFLDEIQECGRARYAIKPLCRNTDIHIIASGSLLGVKGYNRETNGDVPTGSEELLTMYPMDFEEFLLAVGEQPSTVEYLKQCFEKKEPILDAIHERMHQLFRQYMVVGGMPRAVQRFVSTHNVEEVRRTQQSLIEEYRGDFGTFVNEKGEKKVDVPLQRKINAIVDSIPYQLAKSNKKFLLKEVQPGARGSTHLDAIQWIAEFGLASICKKLSALDLPLTGFADDGVFKLYFQDSGLLVSMLDESAPEHILKGDYGIYKGALYENIVADAFSKKGKPLFYFSNKNGLEIDFITEKNGEIYLVEVKAKSGHTKASSSILADKIKYGINHCVKFTSGNIGVAGEVETYPYYLASFF